MEPQVSRRRIAAITAATAVIAASCGGGDGDAGDDPGVAGTAAADDPAPGASFVTLDGETFEFSSVLFCTVGDDFWGPDFRRISLDTGGDYPAISIGYAPPKADDEGVEDPTGVDVFPSVDPWWYSTDAASTDDLEIRLTPDGVAGSATLGVTGDGGPEGEVSATFEVSCTPDVGDAPDAADDTGAEGGEAAPDVDSGTVVIGGETSELVGPSRADEIVLGQDATGEYDFEICETLNPAFAGAYNIAGTLADGTPFRLGGDLDQPDDDVDGLFLGDTFDEEQADALSVSRDGRTISGTATTSRGDVEFSFTC